MHWCGLVSIFIHMQQQNWHIQQQNWNYLPLVLQRTIELSYRSSRIRLDFDDVVLGRTRVKPQAWSHDYRLSKIPTWWGKGTIAGLNHCDVYIFHFTEPRGRLLLNNLPQLDGNVLALGRFGEKFPDAQLRLVQL